MVIAKYHFTERTDTLYERMAPVAVEGDYRCTFQLNNRGNSLSVTMNGKVVPGQTAITSGIDTVHLLVDQYPELSVTSDEWEGVVDYDIHVIVELLEEPPEEV